MVCVLSEGELDADSEIEIHIDHITQKNACCQGFIQGGWNLGYPKHLEIEYDQ